MESPSVSNRRPGLDAEADNNIVDPFISDASTPIRHRYSDFDQEMFSVGFASSPNRVRRALEAHLAETDRRLDEAGKLGTSLVSQRKALEEQLQEVDKLQTEGELGPELRKKLAEIEREYNDLAQESARVLMPKQRVPSNEVVPASPFVPDGRSGRRSVSPSKFETQATGSPTKISIQSRKSRNQSSNRMHDIEFAAEISTSLIAQVRNLQALLSERDEEVKTLQEERSRLEIESENLQQRVKALDESEYRYKEENWNLETSLQEVSSQQREAADREKKLTHALHISDAEKSRVQKELDEVKLSHSKLVEEHAAVIKHHDIELGTAKRSLASIEGERTAMQRKMDDLTTQNQELAKAFSLQRGRTVERETTSALSDDDFETAADNITPDHSPPPSPVKGTPRHSVLETETIKTSLHHAQRTIQSQRSQLHREKTEKLEMRRIIQDLRDDLEKLRNDPAAASSTRRSRKVDSKEMKKSQRLLGVFRSSRQEIEVEDAEWEDNLNLSPPVTAAESSRAVAGRGLGLNKGTDVSDHFETANEASESAFETANERATETEEFETVREEMSGEDDDVETETENPSKSKGQPKRPVALPGGFARLSNRDSVDSNASTSAEENEVAGLKASSTAMPQKSRARLSRNHVPRGSRHASEEPLRPESSSASFPSGETPQGGQSLFAELEGFGGSDDESVTGTPSRSMARSGVASCPRSSVLVATADCGIMTDPVVIVTEAWGDDGAKGLASAEPKGSSTPTNRDSTAWRSSTELETDCSRPVSAFSYSDAGAQYNYDMDVKLAQFPMPPTSPPPPHTTSQSSSPSLGLSLIRSVNVEPREAVRLTPAPPTLGFAPLAMEAVEPFSGPRADTPSLTLSAIIAEGLAPLAQPETPGPELAMAPLLAQAIDPLSPPPPSLTWSTIASEMIEPEDGSGSAAFDLMATPTMPMLAFSDVAVESVEPVSPLDDAAPPPLLTWSTIYAEQLEPRAVSEATSAYPCLAFSSLATEHVEPIPEPLSLPTRSILPQDEGASKRSSMEARRIPPALPLTATSLHYAEPSSTRLATPNKSDFGSLAVTQGEKRPMSPRSPRRNGFIIPRDEDMSHETAESAASVPLAVVRNTKDVACPIIAEDETRHSPSNSPKSETPESQRPLKEISSNSNLAPLRKQQVVTSDHGAQTALTSLAIDKLLLRSALQQVAKHGKSNSVSSIGTPDTAGTVRVHRAVETTDDTAGDEGGVGTEAKAEAESGAGAGTEGRVGSPSVPDAPPLPTNHRQLIDAARSGSPARPPAGSMGPPLWPASAMKQGPRTPSQQRTGARMAPARGSSRTRGAANGGMVTENLESQSPAKQLARSRQSSVSSFASELDSRFNIQSGGLGGDAAGFNANTDPRMIQAITQTMIGEFLWKYTRKTGRGELSENRHRRYFWVHPFTRTLYWSGRDPSTAGRTELKAKSVPIEAVRVVTDDNPMPPGLHRKSLVIVSPGRTIKFTCTTGQRHETWFNALSYLLLRTNEEGAGHAEETVEGISRDDVEEFNPQYHRRRTTNGNRSRAPPSLSSYNSRTTRNESAADGLSINVPTLTPSRRRHQGTAAGAAAAAGMTTTTTTTTTRASTGTFSKLSGYWRASAPRLSNTMLSSRSRAAAAQTSGIYEASEVHDSAEDLREMIEQQDMESHRLENVRACCDGKHDVGTLHQSADRNRGHGSHSHPGSLGSTSLMASARPRA